MANLLVYTVELSVVSTVATDAAEPMSVESLGEVTLDLSGTGAGATVESTVPAALDVSGNSATVESLSALSLNVRSAQ